jgi:hypothetical protein
MSDLTTITTRGGARFTVARKYAPRFEALLNDLEASGYSIDPKQSGGYNPRNIAGTSTPSQHSFGRAVDVNWTRNALGTAGDIDPALAQELSTKHGFTWGGSWKNKRDPMHFEIADKEPAPPVSQRSLVAFAGNTPAPAQPTAPVSSAPTTATPDPSQASTLDQFANALTSRFSEAEPEKRPEDDLPEAPQLRMAGMGAPAIRRRAPNSLFRAVASRLKSSGVTGA